MSREAADHEQDCPFNYGHNCSCIKPTEPTKPTEPPIDVSLCPGCNCMTHTINGKCGKCGAGKTKPIDDELQKIKTELITELANHYYEEYRYDRPNDTTEQLSAFARDIATNDIEELITAAHKQLLDRVKKVVRKNADSGIEYEGNGWHTTITELAELRNELGL